MNGSRATQWRRLLAGLGFIGPNLLGFLAFTLIPLAASMALAFSNWDIRFHNQFTKAPLEFVGIANFSRLLSHPDFWRFFGNTLFLMLGIPFCVAGSLLAALLLNSDFARPRRRLALLAVAGTGLVLASALLASAGATTGITLLALGLFFLIASGGVLGGSAFYRTLFYVPNFTAGVATYILWKKLYDPKFGPVNAALGPVLDGVTAVTRFLPAWLFPALGGLCAVLAAWLLWWSGAQLRRRWRDGETGLAGVLAATAIMLLPGLLAAGLGKRGLPLAYGLAAAGIGILSLALTLARPRDFRCAAGQGSGAALAIALGALAGQFALLGACLVLQRLPSLAAPGLAPPAWLTSYHWAKPAIMLMGFWAAIGSNNMLLYLAGLSNIPVELHEAAAIDGASPLQKFWHVTWPQLAPVTFFILIMSVIGGLQGGFEMARAMTAGGPAGATTTLSYFIYNEGFSTGRLGYASAIAWTLFAMVFSVTLFNWKFGNKYVND